MLHAPLSSVNPPTFSINFTERGPLEDSNTSQAITAPYEMMNHEIELPHVLRVEPNNQTTVNHIPPIEDRLSQNYNSFTETVHTNHVLQDEAASVELIRNPLYHYEIRRVISFPDFINFLVLLAFAKKGFYYEDNNMARCQFCGNRVVISNTSDIPLHNCEKQGNVELPSDPKDYRYESNRILSFLRFNWNKNAEVGKLPVGALELAHWGFYYTGESDAARCIFCRLEVRGWERGDTAETEHRRWNPQCPFICGRTVGNVRLGEEELTSQLAHDNVTHNSDFQKNSMEQLGITKIIPPKYEKYRSLASRLKSFDSWPRSMNQRPEQLSEAGFYYTGKGDRVICYQCGKGLKDWGSSVDNPWVEHAAWSPDCAHLKLHKGAKFINHVQHQKNRQATNDSSVTKCNSEAVEQAQATVTSTSSASKVQNCRQCRICMSNEVGVVFLPCGHMVACTDCAPQLKKCPMCRSQVLAHVRAFLP